jgi:hypothetical protein
MHAGDPIVLHDAPSLPSPARPGPLPAARTGEGGQHDCRVLPGGAHHLPSSCASVLWCVGLLWMQLPVATLGPVMALLLAYERGAALNGAVGIELLEGVVAGVGVLLQTPDLKVTGLDALEPPLAPACRPTAGLQDTT